MKKNKTKQNKKFPTEFAWAMGECLIVPFLLSIGCPYFMTSYVWLFSPILDSWLQPLYARWSDKLVKRPNVCCGFGGRKPFLLTFAILASIGLVITPFSGRIAQEMNEGKGNGVLSLGVWIALIGYTTMDVSYGHMLVPARALVNDIVQSRKEMDEANSLFCLYQALGRICGTLLLCVDWNEYFGFSLLKTQFQVCFVFGLIPLWFAVLLILLCTPHQLSRVWTTKSKTHGHGHGGTRHRQDNVSGKEPQNPTPLMHANKEEEHNLVFTEDTEEEQQQRPQRWHVNDNDNASPTSLDFVPKIPEEMQLASRHSQDQGEEEEEEEEVLVERDDVSEIIRDKNAYNPNMKVYSHYNFNPHIYKPASNIEKDVQKETEEKDLTLNESNFNDDETLRVDSNQWFETNTTYRNNYARSNNNNDDFWEVVTADANIIPYSEGDENTSTNSDDSSKIDENTNGNGNEKEQTRVAVSMVEDIPYYHYCRKNKLRRSFGGVSLWSSPITQKYKTKHARYKSRYILKSRGEGKQVNGRETSIRRSLYTKRIKYRRLLEQQAKKRRKKRKQKQLKKQKERGRGKRRSIKQSNIELSKELSWNFPSVFKMYWCIQFVGWLQVSMLSLYFTSYVGVEIFGGNPRAAHYEDKSFQLFMNGVRYAAMGWVCCGMAATLFSFMLPYVNNFFGLCNKQTNNKKGTLPVYVCGELGTSLLIISLCAYKNAHDNERITVDYLLFVGLMLYGVMTQIHYNNYWVLVELHLRQEKQEDKRARVVQIFNLSIILPSIVIALSGGLVLQLFNGSFNQTITCWGIMGLVLNVSVFTYMWFSRYSDKDSGKKEDQTEANTQPEKKKDAGRKISKRKRIETKMNQKIQKLELKIQKLENRDKKKPALPEN
ncbi:sucrose transmembrane transporter [Reticulomyxa filosa]|uniref:Sucrose transmembrane transporter n=1 Tax=Reticulomyxa filosa TaxID=46433 RepID=X6MKG4_RETFI|nr:sucrose transmembrane transporter [Reticulomyxa filosa]|eukprot:ETO14498.1 sucrose transmembrane transporter [Reticulomyxa filosa]